MANTETHNWEQENEDINEKDKLHIFFPWLRDYEEEKTERV